MLVLLLAGVGERPEAIWVVGALAFAIAIASASQDIAIDAYAVEVLRKDEQGAAVGARLAFYRAAMLVSGGAVDHAGRPDRLARRQRAAGARIRADGGAHVAVA